VPVQTLGMVEWQCQIKQICIFEALVHSVILQLPVKLVLQQELPPFGVKNVSLFSSCMLLNSCINVNFLV
jgi:hypothetical protein